MMKKKFKNRIDIVDYERTILTLNLKNMNDVLNECD